MAATAGMPNLDIGMHLGAGDFNHMGFGSDMMLDPRMGLRLFGIKSEKDHIESPGQSVLTPSMFYTTGDHGGSGNPMDCVEGLPFGDESAEAAGPIHPDMGRTSPCIVAKAPSSAAQNYGPSLASPPESLASPLSASRMPASTSCEAKRKRSATQTGPSSAMQTRSTTKAAGPSSASTATKAHTKRGAAKEAREEARRNRCQERNRIAASKCREKKRAWMQDLETTKAELESQHASLQREYNGLLEEATQIKTSLMNHAGCNDRNIDLWIETEAVRFVRRANRMQCLRLWHVLCANFSPSCAGNSTASKFGVGGCIW
ncbi:hypothetical protein HIM_10910 [Hirsutella minnesotensis 3608]|uniref:BZIP domain-containing protein n=1 Tax=Hirsutella minnesotensis 3608 TaxID=1043627 RepID=A0A0F8A1T4_9HYPO|nr:hypothetical protein HIM_10910 [Hirsutella minnesotensis 3608]